MPHVKQKSGQDMEVERHNVSQRQNQHHHVQQMTWRHKLRLIVKAACPVRSRSHYITLPKQYMFQMTYLYLKSMSSFLALRCSVKPSTSHLYSRSRTSMLGTRRTTLANCSRRGIFDTRPGGCCLGGSRQPVCVRVCPRVTCCLLTVLLLCSSSCHLKEAHKTPVTSSKRPLMSCGGVLKRKISQRVRLNITNNTAFSWLSISLTSHGDRRAAVCQLVPVALGQLSRRSATCFRSIQHNFSRFLE